RRWKRVRMPATAPPRSGLVQHWVKRRGSVRSPASSASTHCSAAPSPSSRVPSAPGNRHRRAFERHGGGEANDRQYGKRPCSPRTFRERLGAAQAAVTCIDCPCYTAEHARRAYRSPYEAFPPEGRVGSWLQSRPPRFPDRENQEGEASDLDGPPCDADVQNL